MLVGLYSAATGLTAAERQHEVIAENLAHVSVPGYRAQVGSYETFESAFQASLTNPSPEGHGTQIGESATDFSQGPTAQTGRTLDVALAGDGFLVVDGPDGPLYTRNGVLFVDQDNQLTNSEGMTIQGENGPLQLPPTASTSDVVIGADGSVSVQGTNIGQLRRVSFADTNQLQRAGTTFFSAPQGIDPEPSEVQVMQGVRELSNVSAVNEMVRMIVGTRHYEAAQRALRTLDESLGQLTDPRR